MSASSVPEGDELVGFFAALAGATWVSAVGTVEGVELAVPDGDGERHDALAGRFSLVSLAGPATGPLFGVFARAGTLSAGRLVKARSAGVWFSAEMPPSPSDAASPAAARATIGSRVAPRGVTPGPPGWAALAAASARLEEDDDFEPPKYGDRVDHFVFGLCDVMVVRGDRLKIRDVNGPGRLREIALGAVKVLPPVEEDGKRTFKLVKRG